MPLADIWTFLPLGYLATIAIETPILFAWLSRRHSSKRRLLASVWLNASSYPIVVLALPLIFADSSRMIYLAVAEVFAPVSECILFRAAFGTSVVRRDFAAIVIANLASFLIGEVLNAYVW